MFKKSKSLLALFITGGIIATSCEKDELHEILPNEAADSKMSEVASSNLLSSINLLFEETIEGSNPFSTAYNMEVGDWDYALQYVSNPALDRKSARFEIREDQPLVKNGKRSEVTVIYGSELPGKEMWYSYAVYFPADYAYDSQQEMINQWYQDRTPATGLRTKNDKIYLHTGNEYEPDNREWLELGQINKGSWDTFVFHFVHSHGSDGLIEVWRNGKKVLTRTGGNMYDVGKMPKFKVGLYKSAFKYGTSSVDKRVLYFDNIRVGNEKASFEEMNPMPVTTTNPEQEEETSPSTSTQNVVSYTLIDSNTEKDIMTIKDGAKLSLSTLGTKKLAIRANTYPAEVGSVKMVMSGDYNRTRIDDVVPYALFGDDRNGGYYSWSVTPGTYTVKARPYAGKKDNIGEPTGPEYSVTFTITK